jgi:hypothetical protein
MLHARISMRRRCRNSAGVPPIIDLEKRMLNKLTTALAAMLVAGAASAAQAQGEFDPNLGNRYPDLNRPLVADGRPGWEPPATRITGNAPARSRDVGLPSRTLGPRAMPTPRDDRAGGSPGGGY